MLFAGKTLQQISEADLTNLIGVTRENESVDFKEFAYPQPPEDQLPADQRERERIKNEWKVDLCSDLSALANASGGWIICGMKEQGGLATELCGLGTQINAEREIARLGQAANSGIEPPITGVAFQAINLQDETKSKVILIHVPRSFRAPHRVKATRKFHVRRSGRNDEMNLDELRASFNLSESLVERIKTFRLDRTHALEDNDEGELPLLLGEGVKLVLHVVPLSFSAPTSSVDLSPFQSNTSAAWVANDGYYGNRYFNFDGVLIRDSHLRNGLPTEYTQIFRNGAIEYVEAFHQEIVDESSVVHLGWVERDSLTHLERGLRTQQNLGIDMPVVVMLSLLGIQSFRLMAYGRDEFTRRPFLSEPLKRDKLLFPDVLVNSYSEDIRTIIKPVFDVAFQAGGWARSSSYDENGNWIRNEC